MTPHLYVRGDEGGWLKDARHTLLYEALEKSKAKRFVYCFDRDDKLTHIVDLYDEALRLGEKHATYNDWANLILDNLDRYSVPTE